MSDDRSSPQRGHRSERVRHCLVREYGKRGGWKSGSLSAVKHSAYELREIVRRSGSCGSYCGETTRSAFLLSGRRSNILVPKCVGECVNTSNVTWSRK